MSRHKQPWNVTISTDAIVSVTLTVDAASKAEAEALARERVRAEDTELGWSVDDLHATDDESLIALHTVQLKKPAQKEGGHA